MEPMTDLPNSTALEYFGSLSDCLQSAISNTLALVPPGLQRVQW